MAAKITKIVIRMGNTEVELTPDEAKELKAALSSLFPDPVYIPRDRVIIRELPWHGSRWWEPWQLTMCDTSETKYKTGTVGGNTAVLCMKG